MPDVDTPPDSSGEIRTDVNAEVNAEIKAEIIDSTDILVIGAGIIGLTCALRLADSGREVLVVDPAPPGSGASFGNAGTIADYAIMPVGHPGVLKNLPALLFDKNSPLAIRRAALFSLAPWLLRFFSQSFAAPTRANIKALTPLVMDAGQRWHALLRELGAPELAQAKGCLYLYDDHSGLAAGAADIRYRKKLGVTAEMLNSDELSQLEPQLPVLAGAAYFPHALSLHDPQSTCHQLMQSASARGARFITASATGIAPAKQGAEVTLASGHSIKAKHVILAAGAHSKALARQAGDRVPLETERGYHLEYGGADSLLQRPACASSRGFYMTPMTARLRVAGTVELGGVRPQPSQHRLDLLQQGVEQYFPALNRPQTSWLGFRPSMPDSRPVISNSRYGNAVIYAFGHGHIGMTLAPVTAESVVALVTNSRPPLPLEPYSAQRF